MNKMNIDQNNNIVISEDKKYSVKELQKAFQEMVLKNNFVIDCVNFNKAIKHMKISNEHKEYELHFVLRNVVNAGWKDKPHIKRIQVQNFKIDNPDLFKSLKKNQYFFFVGYYNFDENPLFIIWDPGRYGSHKTNRSCYVFINSMQRTYETGFFETVNMNRKVWIMKELFLNEFLSNYRSIID